MNRYLVRIFLAFGAVAMLSAPSVAHAAIISVDETILHPDQPEASLNPFEFSFTGLPTSPLTDGTLRLVGFGDFGGSEANENFSVSVDGVAFGTFGPFFFEGFDFNINLPLAQFSGFLADGTLDVVVNFGAGVNTVLTDDFISAQLTYRATTAVPEPGTMSLLALGLAGMFGQGARRRRALLKSKPARAGRAR